jgi:hypothetical protein
MELRGPLFGVTPCATKMGEIYVWPGNIYNIGNTAQLIQIRKIDNLRHFSSLIWNDCEMFLRSSRRK